MAGNRSNLNVTPVQMLKRYLARLCQLFLKTFSDFSDSLLAISAIRQLVAWALVPVCKETFLKGLLLPEKNTYALILALVCCRQAHPGTLQTCTPKPHIWTAPCRHSFEGMAYHVSPEMQQVLVHASLHSLIQRTAQNRQHMSGLPPLGRILLQTGSQSSLKYQLAVSSALANKLQVVHRRMARTFAASVAATRTVRSPAATAGTTVGS